MSGRNVWVTCVPLSGADAFGIMQVSGHSNPQSVKPYLVNTLTGATNALANRKK